MMDLLSYRTVHYIVPPPLEAVQIVREIAAIDDAEEPTDEQKARRTELVKQLPSIVEYRFTVGTCTPLMEGRFASYERQIYRWFKEATGKDGREVLRSEDEGDEDAAGERLDLINLLNRGFRWAIILTSLHRIEERRRPYLEDDHGKWKTVETPAEWLAPDTFLSSVRGRLAADLEDHAHACNPGMWRIAMGDEAKKFGVVSVS